MVHFSAKWSDICQQLNQLLVEMKDELKCFDAAVIEAEEVPEVSIAYKIDAAPTLVFFKVHAFCLGCRLMSDGH